MDGVCSRSTIALARYSAYSSEVDGGYSHDLMSPDCCEISWPVCDILSDQGPLALACTEVGVIADRCGS
jgi:hypothetical protein